MAFFRGSEQLDTLTITGAYSADNHTLTSIKLPNNSTLKLNLAGISVTPSNQKLTNVDQIITLKIIIDWGDGNIETVSPYYHVAESSINAKYQEWSSISHLYSLHDENIKPSLKIEVFNSLKDCATIIIPITIQYQSLLESGAKFVLVSANITNDNQVSYVLNNTADKSSFVVSSKA